MQPTQLTYAYIGRRLISAQICFIYRLYIVMNVLSPVVENSPRVTTSPDTPVKLAALALVACRERCAVKPGGCAEREGFAVPCPAEVRLGRVCYEEAIKLNGSAKVDTSNAWPND